MKLESELKNNYNDKFKKELFDELKLKNVMSTPAIEKIVINSGLGEAKNTPEIIDLMLEDITAITGQKPVVTLSKNSISNFKIREKMPIGIKVTLRGIKMWFFLEKLINIVLPRVKDFRGVPNNAFDGNGNYSLGMKEQLVFPEIDTTKVIKPRGLQVVICTTAKTDEEARALLTKLGMPFAHK